MVIFDTDVMIEWFKGKEAILSEVFSIGERNVSITSITLLEMYVGALNKSELARIKKFLD